MVREKHCAHCGVLIKNVSKKDITALREQYPKIVFSYRPIGSFQRQKFCSFACGKLGGDFAKGERNGNWTGGQSSFRNRLSKTQAYIAWRTAIFMRDDYTCTRCHKRGGYLEAHHCIPLAILMKQYSITTIEQTKQCDELWDISNGITLCRKCHIETFVFLGNQYTAYKTNGVNSGKPRTGNPEPSQEIAKGSWKA